MYRIALAANDHLSLKPRLAITGLDQAALHCLESGDESASSHETRDSAAAAVSTAGISTRSDCIDKRLSLQTGGLPASDVQNRVRGRLSVCGNVLRCRDDDEGNVMGAGRLSIGIMIMLCVWTARGVPQDILDVMTCVGILCIWYGGQAFRRETRA